MGSESETNSDILLVIIVLIHHVDGLYNIAKNQVHMAVVSLANLVSDEPPR